jgi:hypothetical protein
MERTNSVDQGFFSATILWVGLGLSIDARDEAGPLSWPRSARKDE